MLQRLQQLWRGETQAPPSAGTDRHRLAAAALLVTAGAMDDSFDAAERERVSILLRERFALTPDDAEALLAEAEIAASESVDLFGFTQAIKEGFPPEERAELIELVWEVVYTDGVLHDHEANLMRRLAGLLGVSDQESGAARVRVRRRLGL